MRMAQAEMSSVFVRDASRWLFNAADALASDDRAALGTAAHAIGEQAEAIGATELRQIAETLERNADSIERDRLAYLLTTLTEEFRSVVATNPETFGA